MGQTAKLLGDVSLFRNLNDDQLEILEEAMEEVAGVPGRMLFRKGDTSDCFYVIVSGKVSVAIGSDTANPEYKDLEAGNFFGEIGMLRGTKRTADAVVAEPSVLVRVNKEGFDAMMSEDPHFADTVMEVTRQRLRELEQSEVRLDFGREEGEVGRVLVFFSARGGAGTTTLACNFAKKVADLSHKKVCLLDADLEFGACHMLLNQPNKNTLADSLAATGAETVEPMEVQEMLVKLPEGFDLFPCPSRTEDAMRLTPDHLRSIIEELERAYDYVVVDTRSTLSEATLTMFEAADDVFCVLENDIVSIARTIRTLDLLKRAGFETDRFRLVANKVSGFGYPVEDIERDLKREIVFRVEVDVKPVWDTLNAGKLLVDERKTARSAIDIMNGAREYLLPLGDVGGSGAVASEAKKERGFSLWNLFGKG